MTGARAARAPMPGSLIPVLALVLLAPHATATAAEPRGTATSGAVRSIGDACDGRSDAAPAIQAAYDALTAEGGTIVVPSGAVCAIGGAGVVPRNGVALRCEKPSRLLALPGATAMFRTTATLDDWSVTGCEFDLNGVAVTAWESSGGEQGGTRWSFRDNYVHGMPAGQGAPLSALRIDCTLASGSCLIANNTVLGSNSDTRRDTCLTVSAGGVVGFNTQLLGNYLQDCGGDCLAVLRPGGVTANGNVLVRCRDNAVENSSVNSVWTGNQLTTYGEKAGALMYLHDSIGNQVIVGNQLAMNPRSSAPALHAVAAAGGRVAGVYFDSNYAAQGVFFDAKGRCAGGTCDGGACDDDGGCSSCGGRCTDYGVFDHDHVANLIVTGQIRIENPTNTVVQGNVVIGDAPSGPSAQIHLVNMHAGVPVGGLVIAGNRLAKDVRPDSSLACIELDDAGGGGFSGLTITGNACGEEPTIDPAKHRTRARSLGIRLTRPPRTWRSVLIAGNNFGSTADALVGFGSPLVRAGTRLSGNLGLGPDDREPVLAKLEAAGAALVAFAVVAASAQVEAGVAAAARGGPAAVGCTTDAAKAGAPVEVAVAGVADCLALGAVAAIAPGDPLAPSPEPGHLDKAGPGDRVFGYALEPSAENRALRVLVQPTGAGATAAPTLLARAPVDRVRAESSAPVVEPALVLSLEPGRSYAIDGHLRMRAADAGTGVALGFGAPPAGAISIVVRAEPGAAASVLLVSADAPLALLPLAVGDNVLSVSGTVTTAASGGPLELRWAQGEPGPAPLVLQAGSWLRAMELP